MFLIFHFLLVMANTLVSSVKTCKKQEESTSCGLACIAILTGVDEKVIVNLYDKIRSSMCIKRRLRSYDKTYFTTGEELSLLLFSIDPKLELEYHSCPECPRCDEIIIDYCSEECQKKVWREILGLSQDAILYISSVPDDHWIIFTRTSKSVNLEPCIIDPSDGKKIPFIYELIGNKLLPSIPSRYYKVNHYYLVKPKF